MNLDSSNTATFAGGCFWCTEAIFRMIKGVTDVQVGYAGGQIENPSYEEVSKGQTGHVEAIQITYDPKKISYYDLLYVFLKTHDPTSKDKQDADVGPQYRSTIFYHNQDQKKEVERAIENVKKEFTSPIVTEVVPFINFYKAEDYHQDYYKNNKEAAYCKLVIDPKIEKLKKDFTSYIK